MKKILFVLTMLFSTLGCSQVDTNYVNKTLLPSVVEMFVQKDRGFVAHCTAFAIRKTSEGYMFGTAAHCLSRTDKLFVKIMDNDVYKMIPITLSLTGETGDGCDGGIFEVAMADKLSLLKLGEDPTQVGTQTYNAGFPLNVGLTFTLGYVSNLSFEDPGTDFNWEGYVIVQNYGTNPGSSGSPIVCADQKAVCAILVGYDSVYTTALPISRFKEMLNAYDENAKKRTINRKLAIERSKT